MKNPLLFCCLFVCVCSSLVARGLVGNIEVTPYQSVHYEIAAESSLPAADVEAIVSKLEANYSLFNTLFASAQQQPDHLLNVTIFAQKESFEQTLNIKNIRNRQNYIYLYFQDPQKNTLLIYPLEDKTEEQAQLARHSFFSYIFDQMPSLPAWLREGLALYYESIKYNEAGHPSVPVNRLYLDNLKKIAQESPIGMQDFMLLTDAQWQDDRAFFERNLLYAWGIVNFLIFSQDHHDVVIQALNQVSKDKTQEENSHLVLDFLLSQKPNLEQEFAQFLQTEHGYVELLTLMREAYAQKDYENAKNYAAQAMAMNPKSYTPVYYLGLINFENRQFDEAKAQYQKAKDLGAPSALIDFAMGYVYYYGEKDYQQASAAFLRATAEDPVRFGSKVDTLMKNITQDVQSPYSQGSKEIGSQELDEDEISEFDMLSPEPESTAEKEAPQN